LQSILQLDAGRLTAEIVLERFEPLLLEGTLLETDSVDVVGARRDPALKRVEVIRRPLVAEVPRRRAN